MTDFAELRRGFETGRLVPYLGPETLALDAPSPVPASLPDLALALERKVALPARARGKVWAAAQFIESRRHRKTLEKLVTQIFAPEVVPNRLHRWLAGLELPMIVDAWYDDAMVRAMAGRQARWGILQAVTRNGKHEDIWYRALAPDGTVRPTAEADGWDCILYKPHGAVRPLCDFLLSDPDYVEVLTVIDIQEPIPPQIQKRRGTCGFVFLGCRFDDQTCRTFARQIIKRSAGPHYAVIAGEITGKEQRFLDAQKIGRIDLPLAEAVSRLMA
jgi:hypothetical protein